MYLGGNRRWVPRILNWNTSRPSLSIPDIKYQPWKLRHAQRAADLFQRNYSISTPGPSSVRTPISANLGLNFNPGFFFLLSKALSRIIFSILLRVFNHQIVGKEN